jgi:hypothetical protein
MQLDAVALIGLPPDLAQDGDRRHLAPPGRGIHMIDCREQPPTIVPDGQREGGTGCGRRREPSVLGPPHLALPPLREAHGPPPRRKHDSVTLEGVPQRFADHLEAVQSSHGRKTRCGVSSLPGPRLDQVAVATPL